VFDCGRLCKSTSIAKYNFKNLFLKVLDDFASELGSTLEDLAINWEENQGHVTDGKIR